MKRALLLSMLFASVVSAGVPQTVGFSARIVDEKSGAVVSGEHQFKFSLFDAATGGTSVWSEARSLALTDGLLFVELGETQPLSAALFAGNRLFLEVSYDGVSMDPRLALASVPPALRPLFVPAARVSRSCRRPSPPLAPAAAPLSILLVGG